MPGTLTRPEAVKQGIARRIDGRWGFRGGVAFRAATINEEARSIDATLSTESPIGMYDWTRGEIVPEVLLTEGARFASQVPLLDSHARHSVMQVLGSVRGIRKESDRTAGTLHFSTAAEDQFTKAKEGHLTDCSVGYAVESRTYVEEGRVKTIKGKEFAGPVNVVTKWRMLEVSLVSIGADALAQLRGLDPATFSPSMMGEDEWLRDARTLELVGLLTETARTIVDSLLTVAVDNYHRGVATGRREMREELEYQAAQAGGYRSW